MVVNMDEVLKCVACRKELVRIEAELRLFNTGRCTCGGEVRLARPPKKAARRRPSAKFERRRT